MLPTSSGVHGTADARNEQRREKQRGTQREAQRRTRGASKQRERATLPPQRPPCRGRRREERAGGAEARRGLLLSSARQREEGHGLEPRAALRTAPRSPAGAKTSVRAPSPPPSPRKEGASSSEQR